MIEQFESKKILQLLETMANDSNSPLLPYVRTHANRYYFTSDSEDIRSTIDTNIENTGFYGKNRQQEFPIGQEPMARLELKAYTQDEIDTWIQRLDSNRISFEPLEPRKDNLQLLYFKARSELKKDEGIVDEVPGYEIEGKLRMILHNFPSTNLWRYPLTDFGYVKEQEIFHFVDLISDQIKAGQLKNFSITEDDDPRQVDSKIILFGTLVDGQLEEMLTVVTDTLANLYALKIKLPDKSQDYITIRNELLKQILIGQFKGETRNQHILQVQEMMNSKLEEIGKIDKLKRFITVTHESGRTYDVSLNRWTFDGKKMLKWEIEYKGNTGKNSESDPEVAKKLISNEINQFCLHLWNIFAGTIVVSRESIFDWVKETLTSNELIFEI